VLCESFSKAFGRFVVEVRQVLIGWTIGGTIDGCGRYESNLVEADVNLGALPRSRRPISSLHAVRGRE